MQEQLQEREAECSELEGSLAEVRRKAQRDRELLKRATKQHKDRATQNELTVEQLGQHLEETVRFLVFVSFTDLF